MANNNEMNIDVNADVTRAKQQVKALTDQVTSLSKELDTVGDALGTQLAKIGRVFATQMKAAKTEAQQLRVEAKNAAFRGQAIGQTAAGSDKSRIKNAEVSGVTSNMRAEAANVTARLQNEVIKMFEAQMRTTTKAVEARVQQFTRNLETMIAREATPGFDAAIRRQARFSARQTVQNNTEQQLTARQYLADESRFNQRRRAQVGTPSFQNEQALQRLSNNDGADIMAIQTRLMVGYTALTAAFNAFRSSASFIVELQSQFKQFQAVVGATSTEMVTLSDKLIQVSTTSKFSAVEVAQAAIIMGQAGLTARQVADSIQSVSLLATASGTSLAESVDVVTSTLSIFNLQTSQTTQLANTMTSALNESKLSMDKLALGLQYAGNIAAQSGVSYQELIGVLGALANSGIKSGSTLGTGVRQLIIDLQNPTEKLQAIFKQLKISQADVNIESNGLVGVLKNLEKAGFTTADAFQGLEVRAASAFTALNNNIDLASKLEQKFILSTSATRANEVQMQSLSNRWKQFTNIVQTTAYQAFLPAIEALADLTKKASDAVLVLAQYPNILRAIGVAFAGIAAAKGLSLFIAVIRGLTAGTSLLGLFGRGAATAAVAATGLGTATVGAATGARLLFSTLGGPALFAATAAISAAAVAYYAFSGAVKDTAQQIDAQQASLNSLTGDYDQVQSEITAIQDTMRALIAQRETLDKDPLARRTKIMEIKGAFNEIALEIDTSTASVNDLITALDKLANRKIGSQALITEAQITASKQLDETLATRQSELTSSNSGYKNIYNQLRSYQNSGVDIGLPTATRANNRAVDARAAVIDATRRMFSGNAQVEQGIGFATGSLKTDDPQLPSAVRGVLETLMTDIRREREKVADSDQAKQNELEAKIVALAALIDTLGPIADVTKERGSNTANLNILRDQQSIQKAQVDPGFAGLTTKASEYVNTTRQDYTEFLRQSSTMTAEEQKAATLAAQSRLNDRIKEIDTEAAKLIDKIIANNPDSDPKLIANAVENIGDELKSFSVRHARNLSEQAKLIAKMMEDNQEDQKKTIGVEIQGLMRRAERATSREELDTIYEQIATKYDQIAKIDEAFTQAQKEAAKDNTDEMYQADRLAKSRNEERMAQEQNLIETLDEKGKELDKQYYQTLKAGLQDKLDAMKTQLGILLEELKDASALDVGPLLEKIRGLNGMIDQTQADVDAAGFSAQGYQTPLAPVNSNVKLPPSYQPIEMNNGGSTRNRPLADNLARALKNALPGLGLTVQVVSGGQTSSRDPALKNRPGGWTGSTRHNDGNAADVKFRDLEGRILSWERSADVPKLQAAVRALQQQGLTGFGAGPGYMNPETTHVGYGSRAIWGDKGGSPYRALMDALSGAPMSPVQTAERDSARVKREADDKKRADDLADAQRANETKRARVGAASTARSSNREISLLTTQAGNTTDPTIVRKIISDVDAQFAKIMQSRLAAFDTANKVALGKGDEEVIQQRQELIDGINSDKQAKFSNLVQEYSDAIDKSLSIPLEEAKARLDEAQKPENANKYTASDIASLEENVRIQERELAVRKLVSAESELAMLRERMKTVDPSSVEGAALLREEATALDRVNALRRDAAVINEALTRSNYSMAEGIRSATQEWMKQQGIVDQVTGEVIPAAKRMEGSVGEVMGTMQEGFSGLFKGIAMDVSSAEEAFKAFGLSIVDTFMNIISKNLAESLMASLFPTTGGGIGGTAMEGIFSFLGMANGGGIPGAAGGEYVRGPIGTRDSQLRNVMPGEYILRSSAVKAVGKENLDMINGLGNRRIASGIPQVQPASVEGEKHVNVYAVLPEEAQSLGPNDVIAVISNDIRTRGQMRSLIKSVALGKM